ncbi:MAG: hypothetical protein Q7U08_03215, partial [Flavobacteriaceae bacterium]|nr:hypothetical protein [Flavobacteriaceae bacterium]
MGKFLQAFVAFLIWSAIALLFHYFISDAILGNCSTAHHQQVEEIKEQTHNPEVKSDLLLITDDKGKKIFEFDQHFVIKQATDSVYMSSKFNALRDSIKIYLENKPSTNLYIVVNYLKSEINNSTGENFGQKRGEFLKNWFVNDGIPSDRISIETQLAEFDYNQL